MTDLLADKYRAPTEAFWEIERMAGGDGYDVMTVAADRHGWAPVPAWGRDGWDLGSWPLVVIYTRDIRWADAYELAYYVEGDVAVYRYTTRQERTEAIDALAFFHWSHQDEPWVQGVDRHDVPDHLRGPYRR